MYPDRHNTNWFDSWVSCSTSISPNAARGDIHWIMYDLGYEYPLNEIHLWNSNVPDSTDRGVQNLALDYSLDGTNWFEVGEFTVTEAPGSSIYEGEEIGSIDGKVGRYILFNVISNYGASCASFSEVRINVGTVVPIDLISFNVSCEDENEVLLSWETANEINNDHFEIQRSDDGLNWDTIGDVKATLQNKEINQYQFVDTKALSNNAYYRLEQWDLDGSRQAFDSKSVDCSRDERGISIFPNPAIDKINIVVNDDRESVVKTELFDISGKKLQSIMVAANLPSSIKLDDCSPGEYYLLIHLHEGISKKKFIIVE